MPVVVPAPLGALGSTLDTTDDRFSDVESVRWTFQGNTYTTAAYSPGLGNTLVVPSTWPTFRFNIGLAGIGWLFFQVYGQSGTSTPSSYLMGVSIDGAAAIYAGSGSSDTTPPLGGNAGFAIAIWIVTGPSQSSHMAQIGVASPFDSTMTFANPAYVVKSF